MADTALVQHNFTTLNDLDVGDMVEFKRGMYSHWGVYVGDEEVVHLTGDENDGINANVNSGHLFTICGRSFNKAYVKRDNFWNITLESKAFKNNNKDKKISPKSPTEIKESALSYIGEIGYNVLWNNCEHFATLCRYGEKKSDQAETFLTAVMGLGATVMTVFLGWAGWKEYNKSPEGTRETKKGEKS